MSYTLSERDCQRLEISSRREWLLTNGLGGFASGTVSGINTRRYHGLLVAATEPPAGRQVLLASVDAFVQTNGERIGISSNQYPGAIHPQGFLRLRSFSAGDQVEWGYVVGGLQVSRGLSIHRGRNAVTLRYENTGAEGFRLILRPLVSHKFYHVNFHETQGYPEIIRFERDRTFIEHGRIPLHLTHPGAVLEPVQGWYYRFEHARESERGLDARDDLFCPCELQYHLQSGESICLSASTEADVPPGVCAEGEDSETGLADRLRTSARHFLVQSEDRCTIIAGYPWFTDWGRDTMISLPGICLHTGNVAAAKRILHDYALRTFQGLIPNRFPDEGESADYNTVDATLWFANAIYKTLQTEWDADFAESMLHSLREIYTWHKIGTHYGIRMDPGDGLLTQGAKGVQLTWMDAKVGDWVVTPRHGKPVEINALWINMLRILEWLCRQCGEDDTEFREAAVRAESAFEAKFFHEGRGHYVDTVDPLDVSLRPNQLIAMALPFGPASGEKAKRALAKVREELYTPKGIRTLGPHEPGYRGRYEGPLPQMDASYHQGTAWPWLLGSYATALVKIDGDRSGAKEVLEVATQMLEEYGIGGIAEVYDGDAPQRANGCPWQAWSTAEILRAWIEDVNREQ